ATAVRIIGRPGGIAAFTSLARIAVYHRDLSRWNPVRPIVTPTPRVFRVIPPHVMWDFSESLTKLTGLTIDFPFLEFYLDQDRYHRFWQRIAHNYQGQPELSFLIREAIGWDAWRKVSQEENHVLSGMREAYLRFSFHQTLVSAVAPIV